MEPTGPGELRLGESLCSLVGDVSVGVGGVLTISGRADPDEGGVWGRTDVSIFTWLLGRCDRSGVTSFVSFASDPVLLVPVTGLSPVTPVSLRASGAGLVDFLDLKASLILLAGDLDRESGWLRGTSRPTVPVADFRFGSFDAVDEVVKVRERETLSREVWSVLWISGICSDWMMGEEVVSWPMWEG